METKWNNRQGSRNRQALAVLVTADGEIHRFLGRSIPGVCRADEIAYEKAGKWSNSTYRILHHDTTVFVDWMESWELGLAWPQASWEAGYLWLAQKAPALTKPAFDRFVRKHWPKTAERWDEVAAAEDEFGKPSTDEQRAQLERRKSEIEKLVADTQAAENLAAELNSANRRLIEARDAHAAAHQRLAAAKKTAADLEGIDPEKLRVETTALWAEIQEIEARNREAAEAKSAREQAEKARAALGNSLGAALDKIGL